MINKRRALSGSWPDKAKIKNWARMAALDQRIGLARCASRGRAASLSSRHKKWPHGSSGIRALCVERSSLRVPVMQQSRPLRRLSCEGMRADRRPAVNHGEFDSSW